MTEAAYGTPREVQVPKHLQRLLNTPQPLLAPKAGEEGPLRALGCPHSLLVPSPARADLTEHQHPRVCSSQEFQEPQRRTYLISL